MSGTPDAVARRGDHVVICLRHRERPAAARRAFAAVAGQRPPPAPGR
jgi:hypothetical protein